MTISLPTITYTQGHNIIYDINIRYSYADACKPHMKTLTAIILSIAGAEKGVCSS